MKKSNQTTTRVFTPEEHRKMVQAAQEGRCGDMNNPEAVMDELGLVIVTGPRGTRVLVG